MSPEVISLPECHRTVCADVRSLSHVDALMDKEACAKGEAFPTRSADKGFLLGVCPFMTEEVPALRKALSAVHTLEGLYSCVDP